MNLSKMRYASNPRFNKSSMSKLNLQPIHGNYQHKIMSNNRILLAQINQNNSQS